MSTTVSHCLQPHGALVCFSGHNHSRGKSKAPYYNMHEPQGFIRALGTAYQTRGIPSLGQDHRVISHPISCPTNRRLLMLQREVPLGLSKIRLMS